MTPGKPSGMGSPFFTIEEAAAYTKLSTSYLEHSNAPRIKKGRRVVFDREQLDQWMRADLTHSLTETGAADGRLTGAPYCPVCGRPVQTSRRAGTPS